MEVKTERMSLAKALLYKNRLASRLKALRTRVEIGNVWHGLASDATPLNDLKNVDELLQTQSILANLRIAIQKANQPIIETLVNLDEWKSLLAFFENLDERYSKTELRQQRGVDGSIVEAPHTTNVVIDGTKREEYIKSLQKNVDEAQDEINHFNSITTISVEVIE